MKKWASKNNLFTLVILMVAVFIAFPRTMNNWSMEGKEISVSEYAVLWPMPKAPLNFPPEDRGIAIFWATWCAPCKLEMERLRSSVESGKIKPNQIFAINPFERPETFRNFLRENKFPFIFIDAPELVKALNINSTPTTLFLDKGQVARMSTGLSLIGIWWAEIFLR